VVNEEDLVIWALGGNFKKLQLTSQRREGRDHVDRGISHKSGEKGPPNTGKKGNRLIRQSNCG